MAEEQKQEENKIEVVGKTWHIVVTKDDDNGLVIVFRNNNPYEALTEEQRTEIKKDVQDWGKWRIFKELKKDLET